MLAVLVAALVAGGGACPVERAVYRQRSRPEITAQFLPVESGPDWPSRLALRMEVEASGRTYWWLPWDGGSDGQEHLASTTDVNRPGWRPPSPDGGPRPLGDIGYVGTDTSYGVLAGVPRRGGIAPAHFLLPDLREALWYRPPSDRRDASSRQFFDLIRCSRR